MNNKIYFGILYIVPTPIGNMQDITHRAITTLKKVNLILAENIQHSYYLLNTFNINNKIISFNKNNEKNKKNKIINLLKNTNIALICNSGTPNISDPGYELIQTCHKKNISIIPLPGACSIIAALSASGLPTQKFFYAGFLPKKKTKKITFLKNIKNKKYTTIVHESCHRILNSIENIIYIIGEKRIIVLAKEITKKWEKIKYGTTLEIFNWLKKDILRQKGEMIIMIHGIKKNKNIISKKIKNTLSILKQETSVKKAIKITSLIHNINKNILYKYTIKKFQDDKI